MGLFDPKRMAAGEDPALAARTMTVSQLNAAVKRALSINLPGTVHLLGEISNCSRPASGHLYLTIKDERSEIRAVMWKTAAAGLKFQPTDGLAVVATGQVDVYEPRGQYQFIIRKLEPRGAGALELAFRQLCERLRKEGLFESARKRPIPRFPRTIAVVTSPTGAAVHDICQTLARRCPCVRVLVHPVRVQGEGAAQEVASAVRRLNEQADQLGGIDVMIVGRGGGSLEDLWSFNEEIVARAIVASTIPIISGVGHEVDTTIADLAADRRAATPTAAAELAVPVAAELDEMLSLGAARMQRAFARHLAELARRLAAVERSPLFRDPLDLVNRAGQRVDDACTRLRWSWLRQMAAREKRLHELERRLGRVQPAVYYRELGARLTAADHALHSAMQCRWRLAERQIAAAEGHLARVSPTERIQRLAERLTFRRQTLERQMRYRLEAATAHVEALAETLEATSHRRTLARGFSITRDAAGVIITSPAQVRPGQPIATETAGGPFTSTVSE